MQKMYAALWAYLLLEGTRRKITKSAKDVWTLQFAVGACISIGTLSEWGKTPSTRRYLRTLPVEVQEAFLLHRYDAPAMVAFVVATYRPCWDTTTPKDLFTWQCTQIVRHGTSKGPFRTDVERTRFGQARAYVGLNISWPLTNDMVRWYYANGKIKSG